MDWVRGVIQLVDFNLETPVCDQLANLKRHIHQLSNWATQAVFPVGQYLPIATLPIISTCSGYEIKQEHLRG